MSTETGKVKTKNSNEVWIAIQSLLNAHGRGGEWYRHVEFNAKVISQMTGLSDTCVRRYLEEGVNDGRLAKYEIHSRQHMYMYERYNAD